MNRIDRVSGILIQLQSKKIVKGQDIADRFGISLRTVYRDIKTLEEAGVPIVSEAGIGYSLVEGYHLPPVMFTREEATAFLTAEKLVEKLTDPATYKIFQSALFKIKAGLRSDDKEHLNTMYDHIVVLENRYLKKQDRTDNIMQLILKSVASKTVLSLEYKAESTQQKTIRSTDPVGIYLIGNTWYLLAYCLLRKDYRTFRVDRMVKVQATELQSKRSHPPLKEYLQELMKEKRELQKVIVRFQNEYVKYIGEQKYYNGYVSEHQMKDVLEVTFLSASLEGFARWFMMFGDGAEVVSPKELRDRIHEISGAIHKKSK